MGTSLKKLRRAIGRHLGDVTVLTATADTNDTTMVDDRVLTFGDNLWRGRDVYFTGGTVANLGQVRRTVSSSRNDHSITWGVSLPSTVFAGDEAEVWNKNSIGWHPFEVNAAINDTILKADVSFNVPTVAAVPGLFDQDNPTFTIPATLDRIYSVEWKDDCGNWQEFPRAMSPDEYGYYANQGQGTITINGDLKYAANGHDIQMRGYGDLPELLVDTDETELDFEWVLYETAAALIFQNIGTNTEVERKYQPTKNMADAKRSFVGRRPHPNTQVVR